MPLKPTPLFRPQVIRPRVKELELPDAAKVGREKLKGWVENLSGPGAASATEIALLPDYLTLVFHELLGYRGWADRSEGVYTIHREKLVEVDGKFADAVLGRFTDTDTDPVVALEGKGPRDPLERPHGGRKMSAVDQAYRYAINLPCDWLVVTNLREIRLYHKGSTQRSFERFVLRDLVDDHDEFRRFVFILGAERVLPAHGRSHLHELLDASEKAGDELTQEFYATYADIRHDLLNSLIQENPKVDRADVLSAAQQLLDRTLFIAFAEDRSLLPAETLARAYEHHDPYNPRPVWENFRGLFRTIDEGSPQLGIPRYNGGLFREDQLLDGELRVPDESCELLKTIGDYHYGHPAEVEGDEEGGQIVDVEILGHIFEQSIEDLEAIRAQIEGGESSRESSKRRREGAFYTPTFVTQYIVEGSLRPVLGERFEKLRDDHQGAASGTAVRVLDDPRIYDIDGLNNPQRDALIEFWEAWIEELQAVRVLDPACGSGAFLIELFDQLHVEYQQAIDRLAELRPGGWAGSLFDPDRTILQHNLYGVDLNAEAIEIARLSVWIKTAQRGKILTDLDHNIRVGNSIVSDPDIDQGAFDWWEAFPEVFEQGGFDVVVGNPPYVRAEMLTGIKPHLEDHYTTYHGVADLYVYFFELGARVLRYGGRLSYIVSNKWLKTGYAAPLRKFFRDDVWVEEVVDLGHAKAVFPDADVFPSVVRFRRPPEDESPPANTFASVIPRDDLNFDNFAVQIAERGFELPRAELGSDPWTLEPPELSALMRKMEGAGPRLPEYLGDGPSYGIKTGANRIFVIDTATRNRLVDEHPSSAEVIKRTIRGNEIDRWTPAPGDEWIIFTRRGIDIDEYPAVRRYLEQHREKLEPRPSDWEDSSTWPGRKPGAYKWYELQDAIDYWRVFDGPKILHTDIAWRPEFALSREPIFPLNTAYAWPTDDLYLLGVLNSPLLWSYMWRNAQHGKDEALRLLASFITTIPIAIPSDDIRRSVQSLVEDLVSIAETRKERVASVLDWLAVEFGVEKAGQRLSSLNVDADTLIAEVKKRRPGSSSVTAVELKRLRQEFRDSIEPLHREREQGRVLEGKVSALVNEAYGLTKSEIALLWRTAPPRMPGVASPQDVAVSAGRM